MRVNAMCDDFEIINEIVEYKGIEIRAGKIDRVQDK